MFRCFKPAKEAVLEGPPEGAPAQWTANDVKRWFKHKNIQLPKTLKGIDGKGVLAMDESSWVRTVGASGPACRAELLKLAPATEVAMAPAADNSLLPIPSESFPAELSTDVATAVAKERSPVMDSETADQGPKLPVEELRSVFTAFASLGQRDMSVVEMDNSKFMKLARDCQLIDDRLKETDVDFVFLKSRASKDKRRISFKEFMSALERLADKKGVTTEELAEAIVARGGPQLTLVTSPDCVRLHDDRSTYTGVYKQGGPSFVDDPQDLATMLDRERGSRRTSGAGSRLSSSGGAPDASPQPDLSKSMVMSIRRTTVDGTPAAPVSLHDAFVSFSLFGKAAAPSQGKPVGMANAKFVKLCKECGIIDGSFDTTSADIVFSRMKTKGSNTITFREFKDCLKEIAKLKNIEVSELQSSITHSGGPMLNTACA